MKLIILLLNNKIMRRIIFIGMCYSGKTTLGREVAERIGYRFLDSRDLFFKFYKMSENEYLEKYGKYDFQEAEKNSLHYEFEGVLSCGGSAIYYSDIMEKLKQQYNVIWLNVSYENILKRKEKDMMRRPIVYPENIKNFRELYAFRKELYEKYSNIRIDVNDDETIEETTNKILKYLEKTS